MSESRIIADTLNEFQRGSNQTCRCVAGGQVKLNEQCPVHDVADSESDGPEFMVAE